MFQAHQRQYVGGANVEKVQQVLEVERIVNLARGFGWEKTGESVKDGVIVLTIEKKIESPAVSESQP